MTYASYVLGFLAVLGLALLGWAVLAWLDARISE